MAHINAHELRSNLKREKKYRKNTMLIIKSPYCDKRLRDSLLCNGNLFQVVNDQERFVRKLSVRELNKFPVIKSVVRKLTATIRDMRDHRELSSL